MLLDAKPAAFRAGAERIVEGEQARLDLGNGEAGDRAGEFLREQHALFGMRALQALAFDGGAVGEFGHRHAFGKLQSGLEAFGEPLA